MRWEYVAAEGHFASLIVLHEGELDRFAGLAPELSVVESAGGVICAWRLEDGSLLRLAEVGSA